MMRLPGTRTRFALADKVVLVTGAGHGIGAALARSCHRRGARIVAVDIDEASVSVLAAELGVGAVSARADVRDPEELRAAAELATERFGSLDVAIANAGVTPPPATLRRLDPESLRRVLDINVHGALHTVQATAEDIVAARGHIQITGSCSAFMPGPGGAPYMMSKAALEAFARSLRLELASSSVSVGLAMLGLIDTDLATKTLDDDPFGVALGAQLPSPLRARLSPHAAAEAICAQIEKRSGRKVIPASWLPLDLLNGAIPYVEATALRKPDLVRALDDLDARSALHTGIGPAAGGAWDAGSVSDV